MAIYVVPRAGRGEGELVGSNADYRSIFVVEGLYVEWVSPAEEVVGYDELLRETVSNGRWTDSQKVEVGRELTSVAAQSLGPGILDSGWKKTL